MMLGIDASNIRGGGGITYLVGLLREFDPRIHGFSRVVVWSGRATLNRIEDRSWLVKSHQPLLDKGLPYRAFWQRFRLSRMARAAGCDLLFVPGGAFAGDFHPVATISRNMLPFQWRELFRYGVSSWTLRLLALRWIQVRTFRRADGVIFLTRHAERTVMKAVGDSKSLRTIIPHGVAERFWLAPREQADVSAFSPENPLRILYVSTVDVYKHQGTAADAVGRLRANGLPVTLDLIGPAYPPALKTLNKTLDRIDPGSQFVRYSGAVPHSDLHKRLAQAELFLFASTCENMPNILLEAMASGLPIACSNREPMREVLGEAGVYFDPENREDMARALRELIESAELRTRKANAAFFRAQSYSSSVCVRETFGFLGAVAKAHGDRR